MTRRARILCSVLMLSAASFAPARAQIFGPSDEEKAREQAQDDKLAQLSTQLDQANTRLQQLEDKVQNLTQSLAQLTGTNEELNHQLSLMNDKLDKAQKDFSYRLCMLSAQQLGATADNQGLNCAAAGTGGMPVLAAPPPAGSLAPGTALAPIGQNDGTEPAGNGFAAAPAGPGRPPGVLGTLSSSGPLSGGSASGAPAALAPAPAAAGGGAAQFDAATNLLGKAQFTEASAAFRAYADAHPDDQELSSQAIYWVGHIAFIRQDYPSATRAFAEELKKYPDAARSPDAMLQLGQSLLAEGQTKGGCTTFELLSKKYPHASASTLAAAAGARKASCSR